MVEPMQPDLAEAVRRLPAAEQPSWAGPWKPVTSVSAVTSIGSHEVQMVRHARATRAAEFQVAGSRCSRAEQAHPMRTARRVPRLADSPADAKRPAEAALCLESRARNSWARADHPEYEGFGASFRRAQQAYAETRSMPACGGSFAL